MAKKRVNGRQLRHGSTNESRSPVESAEIHKRGSNVFKLRPIDAMTKNILERLDNLLLEMPATRPQHPVDFARIIIEQRE